MTAEMSSAGMPVSLPAAVTGMAMAPNATGAVLASRPKGPFWRLPLLKTDRG